MSIRILALVDEMLSSPKTVAPNNDAAALIEPSPTPAGHAPPHTPLVGGGVVAPVLITEHQVMLATAAAGIASQTTATRRPWIILLWQRLSLRSGAQRQPRRDYPPRRPSYLEYAAMAREMERL
jgi:hypothetical protein